MQAQTTGRQFNNLHKLAGGLLIAASLAAGAIGLTTAGDIEIPAIGGSAENAPAPAIYAAPGRQQGEGLRRSIEAPATGQQLAVPAGRPSVTDLGSTSPRGEGFPMTISDQSESRPLSPLGEGLPNK